MAAAGDAPANTQSARPAYWDAPMGDAAPAQAGEAAAPASSRPAYWDAPLAAAPEPEAPPADATQQQLDDYNRAAIDQGRTDLYRPPAIDNPSHPVYNGLAGLAKGLGLGGRAITEFAASGVQAIAAAHDRIEAAKRGVSVDELRREGTSMEQEVEHQRKASAANAQSLTPSNTEEKITAFGGETAMFLAESILTPAGKLAEGGRFAQAGAGAVKMQVPAVMHGVEVGQEVMRQTHDPSAALKAGFAAYASMTAMGVVPGAMGAGRLAGAATGAAIGATSAEVQRQLENMALPEDMQSRFDPLNTTLMAAQGAVMGGLHNAGTPQQGTPKPQDALQARVVEAKQTAMDHAQADAFEGTPGDLLDKTGAAIQAEVHVGGEHDAAAVHQTRIEAARKSAADEIANAQAAEAELQKEQDFGAAERQAGKAPQAPSADEAFAQREQQGALAAKRAEAQKERDFTAAKNQVGEQQVEQAQAAEEKGGAAEPKPTLAEALPAEQVSALQALRDKLAAQKAANEPAKEPTAAERLKAQNPEDDFQQLGPEVPKKAATEAAKAPEKAKAPAEEEELPEGGPPPVTAQTLAQRRQAALDAAMAAKVRGEPTPEGVAKAAETTPEGVAAPPKGALAERRANARPPLQQGVDPAERLLEEQVKRDADIAAANPEGKRPPLVQGKDLAAPLIEEKARQDAEAAAAATPKEETPAPATAEAPIAAPEAAPAAAKPNRMAIIRAAAEKRRAALPSAAQDIIAELRAGRAKKEEEPSRFKDATQEQVDAVEHTQEEHPDGKILHVYRSGKDESGRRSAGTMSVYEIPGLGVRRAANAQVLPGLRGRGHGSAMLERAVRDAHAAGQRFESDSQVSAMQQGSYQNLRDKGFDVVQNPNAEQQANGELKAPGEATLGESKGVYEVRPPGSKPTGRFVGTRRQDRPTRIAPGSYEHRGWAINYNPDIKGPAKWVAYDKSNPHAADTFYSLGEAVESLNRHAAAEIEGNEPPSRLSASEPIEASPEDRAANPRMTKDELTAHLQPVLDKMPPNLRSRTFAHGVKDDALALPDHQMSPKAKQNLRDYVGTPAGFYDPDTNTVHIFGDGHLTGARDEAIKTLAHEYTHLGLRNILGDKYTSTMLDVADKVKNRQLAKDLIADRGLDMRKRTHRVALGDEYAAHLAENTSADPGLWRTIVDGVRAALRKVGLVRDWTDDDIRDLIRRNNPMLHEVDPAARAGLAYKGDVPRFAADKTTDRDIDRNLDPTDPKAIQYKIARTVEEQMDANRGSIDSRSAWDDFVAKAQKTGRNLAEWGRGTNDNKRLGWIGLRNLPDFMRKDLMPDLHGFIDDHDAMDGLRGRLVNEGADLARKWSKWQAKQDDRGWGLSELMHSSTLLGHDASKPYQSEYTPEELAADPAKRQDDRYQRALHAGLKKTYDAMDPEGREIYNSVRDHYSTSRQRIFDALNRRIEETGADDNTKKQLMAELRKRFEAGKVKGVYFPLQRFGNRWGRAIDPETGEHVSFSRFENKEEQDQWLSHMRNQGLDVDKGQQIDSRSEMERIDPDFVKKVMTLAHDADGSGELEKEIWQTYLKAMPEMSMRKHFIMRQGRLGFTQDALRAFAYNSFHGAHQQARLEYGNRLDQRLANVKQQAEALATASAKNPGDKLADKNSEWGAALAKELEQRLDWIKNPRSSVLASNLTKFGFMWYLGAAPATALRISLQNTMLAQPQIARHFGQIGATRELSRAVMQWAGARGKLSDKLRGDERAAFERAADMGIFSNTNTTMLASGGEGQPMTGAYDKFQRVAGYLFNAMEHKNRMTTFLATYRLGIKKGMSTDDAFKLARNVTWDSHFDYTNANRPGVLQNDFAKVAGLFRQYAWGVTYRLSRDLRDSFKGDSTPHERLAAAHAFSNTMARMMLYAGVTGVGMGFPIYGMVSGLTNAIMNQVDPDRPFDMTSALHEHLQDHLGKTAADAIMTGPASQITGAALSRGASYNDMWYKPPDREMKMRDQAFDALGQVAGPVAAIPLNIFTGADLMMQGHFERGLEHFLPPESAALAKALRYSQEGAKNLKGDTVVDKKDLSKWDIAVQAAGFTPQKIAKQFAVNTEKQNYIDRVGARKNALSTNLRAAIVANDDKEVSSVLKQVDHFNKAHPGDPIGWREIQQIRTEARAAALSDRGVREPKGLREEVQRKFQ